MAAKPAFNRVKLGGLRITGSLYQTSGSITTIGSYYMRDEDGDAAGEPAGLLPNSGNAFPRPFLAQGAQNNLEESQYQLAERFCPSRINKSGSRF
jgi:hypothetical protein